MLQEYNKSNTHFSIWHQIFCDVYLTTRLCVAVAK